MAAQTTAPKWLEDVVLLLGEEKVRKVLRLALAHGDVYGEEAEQLRRIVGPKTAKGPVMTHDGADVTTPARPLRDRLRFP